MGCRFSGMQPLSKYNRGNRYLLVVVDAFSKYTWVGPIIKSKKGIAVTEAFKKNLKHCKRMMEKNFTITHFKN